MSATIVIALVVAVIGGGGIGSIFSAWIAKQPEPGSRENSLIDQLQEMVTAGHEREVESKQEAQEFQRREAILMNYAWECQRHIQDGKPPPPPRWPDDLITR